MERCFQINRDGCNIRCKLSCRELHSITAVVIFCHGFGGHKDNSAAARFADRLINRNRHAALITFNWPCHGDDVRKKLCLGDCLTYLHHVADYARETFRTEAVYAYATSFGGYLTLLYLADRGNPFRKIALRCPAVDMYDVLTGAIMTSGDGETLRRGKDALVGFDRKISVSPRFLEELRVHDLRSRDFPDCAEDILILHGTADEIVPFHSAQSFAEAQLMEFVAIEGADHRFRDPRNMDEAIRLILDFFEIP